jgi:hypothetical protein
MQKFFGVLSGQFSGGGACCAALYFFRHADSQVNDLPVWYSM